MTYKQVYLRKQADAQANNTKTTAQPVYRRDYIRQATGQDLPQVTDGRLFQQKPWLQFFYNPVPNTRNYAFKKFLTKADLTAHNQLLFTHKQPFKSTEQNTHSAGPTQVLWDDAKDVANTKRNEYNTSGAVTDIPESKVGDKTPKGIKLNTPKKVNSWNQLKKLLVYNKRPNSYVYS